MDGHAHVIVPELLLASWAPRVRGADGVRVVEPGGRRVRPAVCDGVDREQILAARDGLGGTAARLPGREAAR